MHFLEFEKVGVEYIWTTLIGKHFWRKLLWRKNLFSTSPLFAVNIKCITLNNVKIKYLFCSILYRHTVYGKFYLWGSHFQDFNHHSPYCLPPMSYDVSLENLVMNQISPCWYVSLLWITKLLDIVSSDIVRRNSNLIIPGSERSS